MILGIPLAVWFGILTILCLFTTFSLGIALHVFKKNVFKYHRFFAITTILIAIIHIVLMLLLQFGRVII